MAGVTSRTILVCAFPAIVTLLTFLWLRKKKLLPSNRQQKPIDLTSTVAVATVVMGEEMNDKGEELRVEERLVEGEELNEKGESNLEEGLRDLVLSDEEDTIIEATIKCEQVQLVQVQLVEVQRLEEAEPDENIMTNLLESLNNEELDEVIESPPPSIYSDGHSEDSSDSGKGGSDIQGSTSNYDFSSSPLSSTTTCDDPLLLGVGGVLNSGSGQVYEFELSPGLCGRLIGRLGKHVNFIKSRTNANVYIKRHPFNVNMKICSVEGTHEEIKEALELIRKRFPLDEFDDVTLVQVNLPLTAGIMVPETLQLNLPSGVTCDVILSSMVSAGHFFVQQPTHPTYPSLSRLDLCMASCYSQIQTPQMPEPVEVGVICSAPTMGGWYRAQVVNINNEEECDIKFVDYGGYSCITLESLRQIRSDFMTLPFQASECYLANVTPVQDADSSSVGWSLESCALFEELAQGQILQALVVGHAVDGVPCVHLYRVQGVSTVFINRELVNRGVADWIEQSQA